MLSNFSDKEKTAYTEGLEARWDMSFSEYSGVTEKKNPYDIFWESEQYNAWDQGWESV